jgi:hypothetical protein
MIVIKLSIDYPIEEHFPNAKCIRGWEGGCAYHAIKDDSHYLFIDERTMAGFMDENDPDDKIAMDKLLHIIHFDDEAELNHYLDNELGWAVNMEKR